MHFGADELQGAAMSVPATPMPFPRVTLTPAMGRIQHANYVAERSTPRFYPYTQALSVLTLKAPAGHSWPPSSTWYHRAGSPPPLVRHR